MGLPYSTAMNLQRGQLVEVVDRLLCVLANRPGADAVEFVPISPRQSNGGARTVKAMRLPRTLLARAFESGDARVLPQRLDLPDPIVI